MKASIQCSTTIGDCNTNESRTRRRTNMGILINMYDGYMGAEKRGADDV